MQGQGDRQDLPSVDERNGFLWDDAFSIESLPDSRIVDTVNALQGVHLNGGAIFSSFSARNHSFFDCLVPRTGGISAEALARFLESDIVAKALPMLGEVVADDKLIFDWGSPLTLDGEIAIRLLQGGAYARFLDSANEAKRLGQQFCDAIFDQRYRETLVYRSTQSWSEWFKGLAWDVTWLIIDREVRRISLLCVTDTD